MHHRPQGCVGHEDVGEVGVTTVGSRQPLRDVERHLERCDAATRSVLKRNHRDIDRASVDATGAGAHDEPEPTQNAFGFGDQEIVWGLAPVLSRTVHFNAEPHVLVDCGLGSFAPSATCKYCPRQGIQLGKSERRKEQSDYDDDPNRDPHARRNPTVVHLLAPRF